MSNLYHHKHRVSTSLKTKRYGHKPAVIWLTGLSGSGKSTIANLLETKLFDLGCKTYILDGDNVRLGLNKDLGFSPNDRKENIRRIGEVANLFADSGMIALAAFISPYRADRQAARDSCSHQFIEVYVDCDIDECERRDPKGLYKRARAGEIRGFTGIDAPYEKPMSPDITISTNKFSEEDCANKIIAELVKKSIIRPGLGEVSTLDKSKTIAVDFDGVIHAYSKGFSGLEDAYDPPHCGAEAALIKLKDAGFKLIVISSRPAYVIRAWLDKNGFSAYFDDVTNVKRPASFYIDDHAIEFEKGNQHSWSNVLDKILGQKKEG